MSSNRSPRYSADYMIGVLKSVFDDFPCPYDASKTRYSLSDCLLSGLAVFGLKLPSLLQLESLKAMPTLHHNMTHLYKIDSVPSDTQMRERLDSLPPYYLRRGFNRLLSVLQRGKVLQDYQCIDEHYLLSLDGTGYFSSKQVHCEHCCQKSHRNGTTTYYHQMLSGAIVHPDKKQVFPLPPEAIMQQDGGNKNDCEQNAAKRFLSQFRNEHPHMKVIVLQDSLSATGPHIRFLQQKNLSFILSAKQLHRELDFFPKEWVSHHEVVTDGITHRFRVVNDIRINGSNMDVKVNLIEYQEDNGRDKPRLWSWVTDLPVTNDRLMAIMRAARSRWKIENETFNTLKNQGYNFEHNYGHGKQNLSYNFAQLMLLAFFIDQIQQHCCALFKKVKVRCRTLKLVWQRIRGGFEWVACPNFAALYDMIIEDKAFAYRIDTT